MTREALEAPVRIDMSATASACSKPEHAAPTSNAAAAGMPSAWATRPAALGERSVFEQVATMTWVISEGSAPALASAGRAASVAIWGSASPRSDEDTTELQSHLDLVYLLLLVKKKNIESRYI